VVVAAACGERKQARVKVQSSFLRTAAVGQTATEIIGSLSRVLPANLSLEPMMSPALQQECSWLTVLLCPPSLSLKLVMG